jgi:putative hydrolase of the HAD superfamily
VGRPVRSFFFDLDDTILAYSVGAAGCWERLCSQTAPRLPDTDASALMAAIDRARDWYWSDAGRNRAGRLDLPSARRQIVQHAFKQLGLPRELETVGYELADSFSRARLATVDILPGARETLDVLRMRGARLGLLTNGSSKMQRAKLERFDLVGCFDLIVIEEEFGAGKPDARVFRHALQQLRAAPADAWMVGDNLVTDVAGAQGVGMRAIWVDHRDRGLPDDALVRPDRRVASIAELVA